MEIKGFIKNSFIDWSGKISSIVFLPGCQFRCPFCQNKDLVLNSDTLESFDKEDIFLYLKSKTDWIDGVVITGGEPTLHNNLKELIKDFKNLGLKIKLDTNGYKPDVISDLLNTGLIDYIAMDIKTALDDKSYSKAVGVSIDILKILESINLIMNQARDYEFRTTIVPTLVGKSELRNIAQNIKHAKRWVWQEFKPQNTLDETFLKISPYNINDIKSWEKEIKPIMKNIIRL